jgi:hypothetical protein
LIDAPAEIDISLAADATADWKILDPIGVKSEEKTFSRRLSMSAGGRTCLV